MFNLVNTKSVTGPTATPNKLNFGQTSSAYWDGNYENTHLIICQSVYLDKESPAGKDLAMMPIVKMSDGTWHELGSVLFDARMEPAGVSEPGARFDDIYDFHHSVKALEELPQVANQIEAAALVKARGATAFTFPEEYRSLELSHFLIGIDVAPYQDWLKMYVTKYHADRYEEIFDAPFHQHTDYTLSCDKSNGIYANGIYEMNRVAARLGVSFVSMGDGVYDSNRFKPGPYVPYLKNPMRAFAKLPPIRITDWERETFNGTDNG